MGVFAWVKTAGLGTMFSAGNAYMAKECVNRHIYEKYVICKMYLDTEVLVKLPKKRGLSENCNFSFIRF